jgi:hypothetical protein
MFTGSSTKKSETGRQGSATLTATVQQRHCFFERWLSRRQADTHTSASFLVTAAHDQYAACVTNDCGISKDFQALVTNMFRTA